MLFGLVISLVPTLKQQFNELINGKSQTEINQTNQSYYFYNEMINLKNFESKLVKINKKHYKGIDIYFIRYITVK